MTKEHVRGKSEDGIIQNSEGLKRSKTHSRREVLVGSAAAGALVIVRGEPAAAADAKKTFTTGPSQYLHRHRRLERYRPVLSPTLSERPRRPTSPSTPTARCALA